MGIENAVDLLLVILYSPGASKKRGEPIKGLTRMQKLFFLLWKEGGFDKYVPELRNFIAYNYGPFSNELFDDIEFAESIDLIKTSKSNPEFQIENTDEIEVHHESLAVSDIDLRKFKTREDFGLTERGLEVAKEIWNELGKEEKELLRKIKTLYNNMPFMQLIRYVYSKYPDYAKESVLLI